MNRFLLIGLLLLGACSPVCLPQDTDAFAVRYSNYVTGEVQKQHYDNYEVAMAAFYELCAVKGGFVTSPGQCYKYDTPRYHNATGPATQAQILFMQWCKE